ncbi:MAG: hypothetical protein IK024_03620 [Treponema sp.]|nr:hypothetical protein [Treponema sp.]
MKKLFVCVFVALTVFTGVFAQEAADEQPAVQPDQIVIKFNVLDSTWSPKIYVSKYPNFMGKQLIATGSGEVTLENPAQFGYIGFNRSALQPLKYDSDFLEFDVEKGNPGLYKLGLTGTIIGCIASGVGLGMLMVGMEEGDKSTLVPFGALAAGGLGIAIGGYVISNKNKPRLILITN